MDIDGNIFRGNHSLVGSAAFATLSSLRFTRNLVESNSFYSSYPLPTYLGSQEGAVALTTVSEFLIEANTIRGNVASTGAGLSLQSCAVGSAVNNLIVDNRAYDVSSFGGGIGGGIHCMVNLNATNIVIANNTLVGNTAPAQFGSEMGGAIGMTLIRSNLTIANNIIASNSSGIWRNPGSTFSPALRNNCVNNSNGVNYLNLSAGLSDFSADPRLANRTGGDFRLQAGSPCIDTSSAAGEPAFDLDSVGRPLDGDTNGVARADIGAFEFAHPAADTDGDGMRDASEVIAGTNPADAVSLLRLAIHHPAAPDRVALTWPSVPRRTYRIEFAPSLPVEGTWHILINGLPGTGDELKAFDYTFNGSNRFYRVAVVKDDDKTRSTLP